MKNLQDHNIFIPKNREDASPSKEEATVLEDQINANLQAEVRKLHQRLQQKERLIKELRNNPDFKTNFPVTKTLILDEDEQDEFYEKEVIQILTSQK